MRYRYLLVILPITLILIALTIKASKNQKIIVVVKEKMAGSVYSKEDAVVCMNEAIGKVDSVGLYDGNAVYFISLYDGFHIPEQSKVIRSDKSILEKQIEFICSAKSNFKLIDTFYIEANPKDKLFNYTLEYQNLNKATEAEKEDFDSDVRRFIRYDSVKFTNYKVVGPNGNFGMKLNLINDFWKTDSTKIKN